MQERIRKMALAKAWVTEELPFDEQTLVYKVAGKMFLLMSTERVPLVLCMKCDPRRAIDLRASYPAITGAFHLNKTHWNAVAIDGSIPWSLVEELVQHSYDLVYACLTRKVRMELEKN